MYASAPGPRTPLPWSQLLITFAIQLSEPLSATVVYPFLPQFVRQTGITEGDETRTGYYSGIIGSVFFAAECLTVFHWARASDRFGRRSVLLLGPLGLAVSMTCFGLSSSFWMLVALRALQGICNGNIGVAKTVMAELTDSTNIGDAFAIVPMMWGLGNAIGPAIGGALASPANTWPDTMGKFSLLRIHPYFLPCIVAAACTFSTFVWAAISLRETHPYKRSLRKIDAERRPLLQNEIEISDPKTLVPPPLKDVLNRNVVASMANYCATSFISMMYTVLMPLMWSTSIPAGGLGFSPSKIGTILAIWGFANAGLQILFLARLLRRFGERTVFVFCAVAILLGSLAFGLQSTFARWAGHADGTVWFLLCFHLLMNLGISAQYSASQVLMVRSVTHPLGLSATNGLAQMAASATRGLCPYLVSSLFSITLQRNIVGGFFIYICISLFALGAVISSFWLPKKT
ncbi:major facilitator superfamily multidrug-resistance, DHA1 sub-family [Cylindrobasidium torrendii FP15055 ss-10]|uniref:Major facilitator superfamily multidrug-resistance, DHA1 sub-family n=1 Tax=Cylindrobasidium torrendii FP15055 ss-10 TaxID=1314674 RepID=A0A0D7BNS4_9AGAR|nr:major facilitator superfamily multidrug-resistance, DHA1 sub-family [Cylindrobasidium torrendii FP15055 ss-10]